MKQLKNSTWIAIAVAVIVILILLVMSPNILRIVLFVPLVLFLPGFALTLILFPGKSIGIPQRLLLSLGLSVAFTALTGLALNLTPGGLQASNLWIVLLASLAVEIIAIFFARRSWWLDTNTTSTLPTRFNFNARQWTLMAIAALLTIMAIRVARTPTPQQGLEGYTMLWINPEANTATTVRVGVQSEEFQPTSFHIKYEFNGAVREGSTFKLNPGETWERNVPIPAGVSVGNSLTVLLYRLDSPDEVYRRLVWWPSNK